MTALRTVAGLPKRTGTRAAFSVRCVEHAFVATAGAGTDIVHPQFRRCTHIAADFAHPCERTRNFVMHGKQITVVFDLIVVIFRKGRDVERIDRVRVRRKLTAADIRRTGIGTERKRNGLIVPRNGIVRPLVIVGQIVQLNIIRRTADVHAGILIQHKRCLEKIASVRNIRKVKRQIRTIRIQTVAPGRDFADVVCARMQIRHVSGVNITAVGRNVAIRVNCHREHAVLVVDPSVICLNRQTVPANGDRNVAAQIASGVEHQRRIQNKRRLYGVLGRHKRERVPVYPRAAFR